MSSSDVDQSGTGRETAQQVDEDAGLNFEEPRAYLTRESVSVVI
jgi:hypothetical protein